MVLRSRVRASGFSIAVTAIFRRMKLKGGGACSHGLKGFQIFTPNSMRENASQTRSDYVTSTKITVRRSQSFHPMILMNTKNVRLELVPTIKNDVGLGKQIFGYKEITLAGLYITAQRRIGISMKPGTTGF